MDKDQEFILNHARQFHTLEEWEDACKALRKDTGKPAICYQIRWLYGDDFYQEVTRHLRKREFKRRTRRLTAPWRLLSEDEIIASAKQYTYKNEWKYGDRIAYRAARNKDDDFYLKCTEHMLTPCNPYNFSYTIYAYEFSDRHAYVGLTFRGNNRFDEHEEGGRVFDHIQVCPVFVRKVVEDNIPNPSRAGMAERRWVKLYTDDGWIMLNKNRGGSTGSIASKITDEMIFEDARKYQYRFDWIIANQSYVKHAKERGIYAQCIAHMPRRRGNTCSAEKRLAISLSNKGRPKSEAHKLAMRKPKSEAAKLALKEAWVRRRARQANIRTV
jgi:hypothetical protein